MIFDEIQSVPMKAVYCLQVVGIKSNRYKWASDFMDFQKHPDFPLQLMMRVDDYGWLTSKDITTSLNLIPKNMTDMPKDMSLGFNDDGTLKGFSVIQILGGKNRQYTGLIELADGEILSTEIRFPYKAQNEMRERLDRTLGEEFPYAEATYELLAKSIPVGGYEKQFGKYKRAALKRLEKYVLR